jgi:hypothetical protein
MKLATFAISIVIGLAVATQAYGADGAREARDVEQHTINSFEDQLAAIGTRMVFGDTAGALEDIKRITASPEFARTSTDLRTRAYTIQAVIEATSGAYKDAQDDLLLIEDVVPGDFSLYWQYRWIVSLTLNDYEDAVWALSILVQYYPDVSSLPAADILRTMYYARVAYRVDEAFAVYDALWRRKYAPKEHQSSLEELWVPYLALLQGRGGGSAAAEVAATLRDPQSVQLLAVDRRFAALAPPDPDAAFRKSLEADLYQQRSATPGKNERSLQHALDVATALAANNELPAALDLLDTSVWLVRDGAEAAPHFDDVPQALPLVHQERAYILELLGGWSEAGTARVEARDAALITGTGVVITRVNLGVFYDLTGEPDKAIKSVTGIYPDASSPFGLIAAESVRTCAYAVKGDDILLEGSLDYVRAHVEDGYTPAKFALLCSGRLDELAALIIKRLADENTRLEQLLDVQTYLPNDKATDLAKTVDSRMAEVIARPDVAAAIKQVGIVRSWPTYRTNY